MKAAKTVKIIEEAQHAIRRNPPSDKTLIGWMNGYTQTNLPTDEQIRWIGYFLLALRGYEFTHFSTYPHKKAK